MSNYSGGYEKKSILQGFSPSEETVIVDLSQEGPGGAAFDMSFFDEDGPTPIDGSIQ